MTTEIAQIISQYGFPIVACIALFWQNEKQDLRHQEEAKNWAEALATNTTALAKLEETIRGLKDGN